MNVVVDGLLTNYLKNGDGSKALVLLHGWGDSADTYSKLIENLHGMTIYSLDLPGFGGTQHPKDSWGLSEYATFVSHWLNKISVKQPYSLAGHSFGGAVAIAGTANKDLNPNKLILLASSGIRDKKNARKKALRLATKAARIPLYVLPAAKAQNIKQKFYNRIGSDALLIPSMRGTFTKVVGEDIRLLAAKITKPTLLIYGDKDKETPVEDGLILNEAIKNSKLETLNTGHFVHQELAEKVAYMIEDFLNKKT